MRYYGTNNGKEYGFTTQQDFFTQAVEVTENDYQALLKGQSNGQCIIAVDGKPVLQEVDTTPTVAQLIAEQQEILDTTDWYVTRHAETGKEIPAEILTKRQAARDKINELRSV